ncbi:MULTISPECIES: histidine phosphatase family protein [unclassified Arthrobacter]|uniref:histidine phosphatase family protein n=1 Tax=unclassified Arthrobacter TaxID=235627 RepID=UPI001E59FDA7|nr:MULTISPECIES: histidine phosphatase family protein [unclassified Arthrobacter]MCC9144496.1 histidine phosphatase family protein [Arthrobacter sp. zg-Y919]MDK1275722.1 histidine phosphatase family protein [Arthrobacter sp. zg.Y919]WIB02911.1 histidine phosphatase family protein [Arthrobacter sp. zg-Y919]
MTTFFLVRHGETVWHAENRYAGLTDVALTPHGLNQGDRLAAWAATASLTGVWSSPLSRAEFTARKAATAASLPLNTDARLAELDFGEGEGLTKAEMQERFPESLAAFEKDPVVHHLPGGEDPTRAASRFCEILGGISAGSPAGRVLVVAHSTVLRLALATYLGINTSNYRRVFPELKNCSLTELRLNNGQPALLRYNADAVAKPVCNSSN